MPVYCITGSNRGIGLEFVRQLAQNPDNTLLVGVRSLSSDLNDLEAVTSKNPSAHILELDVSSEDSIKAFVKFAEDILQAKNKKIDYLLNSAGVNIASTHNSLNLVSENVHAQIAINVLGPAQLTASLLKAGLLSNDVRVLNMTSGLGSAQLSIDNKSNQCAGYSISKAGLNMLSIHQAHDLRAHLPGVVVGLMDPGWVKTRLGGSEALVEPKHSVEGMLSILHGLKDEDNGSFFHYDGKRVPW
ncbi:C-factor [Podospora fimiseda]|uniref:C-factor n=1 Tax=Podospora fimiseda TaxID=252190 RepID=A0AAN6YPC3_9PEZI|nr:C-factor [Podospora fimiseda]